MLSGDEVYGDDITSGPIEDDNPGFRSFCMESECGWSSHNMATYDTAEGAVEDHLRREHGLTDVGQFKYEIDDAG